MKFVALVECKGHLQLTRKVSIEVEAETKTIALVLITIKISDWLREEEPFETFNIMIISSEKALYLNYEKEYTPLYEKK